MATTFASLGLDKLDRDEKITVLEDLTNDFAEQSPPGSRLTDAQHAELKRRIAHADAHPNEGISFEDFYERTLKKYEL